MKRDCHKKKIDFIYNRLWDMFSEYRKIYKKRFQIHENMISKFRESSYRKDGDKYKVFWKGEEVGEYIGPGKPTQFHNYKYILHSTQKVKLTEATVRKTIPLRKITPSGRILRLVRLRRDGHEQTPIYQAYQRLSRWYRLTIKHLEPSPLGRLGLLLLR